MTYPRYTPLVASLPASVPFVGPETHERERGASFIARIGANENVFGPSPKAISAMQDADEEIWKYGDSLSFDLRAAIADENNVRPENVIVGEGIDGLLGYLVRLVVGPGDHVVTSDGAYPTFNYHVTGYGGTLHKVPYRDDREDPSALIAKAAALDAKLVYIANPDNPMGTWHSGRELHKALDTLPEGCLLIVDEAYVECAPEGTILPADADDPRLIRMRTFSKIYGMAGARVGYALAAPELIAAFDKVRNHFGMNRSAQVGALAAIQDKDWLAHVKSEVSAARDRISDIARRNGLTALPSATNFVAVDCGRDGEFARAVLNELVSRGIFVRMPFAAPQNRCIRVSCGRPVDLDAFAQALPEALKAARESKEIEEAAR
ncbi:pyridoxal phosphate-dependent aminotransferase [Sulfitobacter sp. BDSS02]|nr:pyridoxal phosphate-dependent aminotransferase [Sulfitobacter sp. BDSS02]MBR9851999.1 pyridoxal phosphate-dependent aminotransferase [Paracoccaceae bacterium]